VSTFEAHVSDDFMIDGVAVYISLKHDHGRQILHISSDGTQEWADHEPLAPAEPTLKLPGEAARALLDALLRHYEGAPDMRTARQDLLHERGRVDKLTDAVIGIAQTAGGGM